MDPSVVTGETRNSTTTSAFPVALFFEIPTGLASVLVIATVCTSAVVITTVCNSAVIATDCVSAVIVATVCASIIGIGTVSGRCTISIVSIPLTNAEPNAVIK